MRETFWWPTSAIFAVVTGTSLLVTELSTYDLSGNGQQVLSTLASIQASVFAIVFSVVILGIQLSTSRYATRLANLFRSDGAYKKTVGLFATSLGVDVATLLAFTHVSPSGLRFLMSSALGLAVASFAMLYFFVDRTLEQTTPEGIIDRVEQELTPEQIISDAKTASDGSSKTDPFLVPVSIIRSAVEDRDLPAVTYGLTLIDNQVQELLEHTSVQTEEDTPVGDSLEELSVNRLPNVAEKSVQEDLEDAGKETVNTISSIGGNAVDQDHEPVALHTARGLARLVGELDFDKTDEIVRKEAVDESGDHLKEAAEAELWDASGTGVRLLAWRAAQSVVRRGPTERVSQPYNSLSIRYIPDVLEKVVDGTPDDIEEENIFRGLTLRDGEHASPPLEWALWSCYAAMAELTSSFIRYELKNEEEIVDWEGVSSGWRSCILTLEKSDCTALLRYWLGTVLYLEYIESELESQYMDGFQPNSHFEVSADVLEQTFAEISDGVFDPKSRIDLLPGRIDPVEFPRTGHPSPPVSEPEQSFEEWCERQKKIRTGLSVGMGTVEVGDDEETADRDDESGDE